MCEVKKMDTTAKNNKKMKDEERKLNLAKAIANLENTPFEKKELANFRQKLKKLSKAGITKDNLDKIVNNLIMSKSFKGKFLKSNFRRLSRLLAEYGLEVKVKEPQLPRQSESPETYGYRFPHMAVDPEGHWVAQAADIGTRGAYNVEIYELKDQGVSHSHVLNFTIKGDKHFISQNDRIKGLAFNQDGTTLWISAGSRPPQGPFKTWLIKFDTGDWSYEIFGPIQPYHYFDGFYSRAHFNNLCTITEDGREKILAPVPSYSRVLGLFDPADPTGYDPWLIEAQPDGRPNFFIRFTDSAIVNNRIYAAGWAENAATDGIANPRAAMVVINKNSHSVEYGPYYVPSMMGRFDYITGKIWPLKIRPDTNGIGAYLIAEKLAPTRIGLDHPDHSGYAYINCQTNEIQVRDKFPHKMSETLLQEIRDVVQFGDNVYVLRFKRDTRYNSINSLIRLDDNLYLTDAINSLPEDWWNRVYAESHPTNNNDVIISAVRTIYHPNLPSGLIALWKAF